MMNHDTIHIPGHTLVGKIGEGGMGAVYLATDNLLQRQVAIKALKSSVAQGEETMLRFQAEAVTLAKLRHPHITILYNLIQANDQWCMIMEYVEGQTIDSLLKSKGKLGVLQVLELAIPILDALQHAHSKGVVHRDLKPSNLMLSAEGEVKIMDFGIARIAGGSRLTRVGQAVGTPQYMSPEQIVGHEGNYASDIYSLGIVLYELLTGVTPFDSESEFEIMQAHTNRKPIPPVSLNPDIPAALNNALMKALEKEVSKRFDSANEFKQCLLKISERFALEKTAPKRLSFKWERPVWKLPKWTLPKKLDRQYLAGAAFLAASILVASFVLFRNPQTNIPKSIDKDISEKAQKPQIEIEPETDMGAILQGTPNPPPQRMPENPPRHTTQPPIQRTAENPSQRTAENPPQRAAQNPPPPSTSNTPEPVSHLQKEEPVPSPAPPAKPEPNRTSSLGKQVVIPRGTRVDAILDSSYDYASAQHGMSVTLSVETAVERSGVVVVSAGAKVHAILHKNARKQEMELVITEVESVTGKPLKSMSTSFKASGFKKGEKYKINLDYNRLD